MDAYGVRVFINDDILLLLQLNVLFYRNTNHLSQCSLLQLPNLVAKMAKGCITHRYRKAWRFTDLRGYAFKPPSSVHPNIELIHVLFRLKKVHQHRGSNSTDQSVAHMTEKLVV